MSGRTRSSRSAVDWRTVAYAVLAVAILFACQSRAVWGDGSDQPKVSIVPRAPRKQSGHERGTGTIRADVNAILVPVTVTDIWDRPIDGLQKDDFQIFEDNVKQKIISSSVEEQPASVGLVFDASGSMSNKITASVNAVDEFFKTTLPGDEFSLVRFSDKPQWIAGFTPDAGEISRWLHSIRPAGWTALNDALYLGIQKMKTAKNGRRVLLVLSDGGDNNSRYSTREIRSLVRESGVAIYSISFFQGSRLLESVSDETGGRLIQIHHMPELPDAIEKLSRAIRSQYVLTYYSRNPERDGKYRRVRVELSRPMARVSWRHGYYAPLD
jgi:Ca-activated chloride channel family protein